MMRQPSLKKIVAEVLECHVSELSDHSGINATKNWDSLKQFLIISAIEQELSATFSISDMENITNLGQIRSLLSKQGIATID